MRRFQYRTAIGHSMFKALWGDKRGLMLFLGAITFFGISWRVGVFINDNFAIVNTLAAVAQGQLAITDPVFQHPEEGQLYPGMFRVEGETYGRNYGQVFLALPFLGLVWVLSEIMGLKLALVALWAGAAFGFTYLISAEIDRKRLGLVAGSSLTGVVIVGNMLFGRPIDPELRYLAALQLMTILAAAFIGVFIYRTINRLYDRDLGLVAGALVVLSTSIGYWATIPKRHALIAALVVAVMYCFLRSRESTGYTLRFRAIAYAIAGFTIWVHPPDGVTLLMALAFVDTLTGATETSLKHAGILGSIFVLSLLPYFLTNVFTSGNPFLTPRYHGLEPAVWGDFVRGLVGPESPGPQAVLSPAGETPTKVPSTEQTPTTTRSPGGQTAKTVSATEQTPTTTRSPGGQNETIGLPSDNQNESKPNGGVENLIQTVTIILTNASLLVFDLGLEIVTEVYSQISGGLSIIFREPERVYHTFVRSSGTKLGNRGNLTVLETMPIFGVFAGVGSLVLVRLRESANLLTETIEADRHLDSFIAVYILLVIIVYQPRLPTKATINMRYLVPVVPGLVYFIFRLPLVRQKVESSITDLMWYYAMSIAFWGGLFAPISITVSSTAVGHVGMYATAGFFSAIIVAIWSLISHRRRNGLLNHTKYDIGLLALSLASAYGTIYILFPGVSYYSFGTPIIPFF